MTQTLEHAAPVERVLPLILRGATKIVAPHVPPIGWNEKMQISVVPGTDVPACTREEYRAESTSSCVGDNIKDVDD